MTPLTSLRSCHSRFALRHLSFALHPLTFLTPRLSWRYTACMFLRSIKLGSFRSLAETEIQFAPGFNILFGNNGQGKTNLLEAIYLLANTKSFRTHRLHECARFGSQEFWLSGEVCKRSIYTGLTLRWGNGGKELRVNNKAQPLLEYIGHLDALVISFDQLPIVRGAPEQRRKFLDRGIAQLRKTYLHVLAEFHHTLRQRNHLLTQIRHGSASVTDLEVWESIYAERALVVSSERERYAEELNRVLPEIKFSPDSLRLRYLRSARDLEPSSFCETLARVRAEEIRRGRSLKGPHRDDVQILIGDQDIQNFGSGGQQRSAVFSLLLAAMSLYFAENQEYPVLLIDDIDAELDMHRLAGLLDQLRGDRQVFLSTSKKTVLESIDYEKGWKVCNGAFQPAVE